MTLPSGVLFADVRNSTAMGERSTASDFAKQLNRFYAVAAEVLIRHDGLIDKLIGDEVMGLFLAGLVEGGMGNGPWVSLWVRVAASRARWWLVRVLVSAA